MLDMQRELFKVIRPEVEKAVKELGGAAAIEEVWELPHKSVKRLDEATAKIVNEVDTFIQSADPGYWRDRQVCALERIADAFKEHNRREKENDEKRRKEADRIINLQKAVAQNITGVDPEVTARIGGL